ncbi:MAG: peptidylprolyl isomerase [Candidatus Gracilibacteria bacterium]|nr:peptidylprolyl isomerase [Candidatus Gracilibacteria bacterium]
MRKFNKTLVLIIAAVLILTLSISFFPDVASAPLEEGSTELSYQEQLPQDGDQIATLETNLGNIKIRLFATEAPKTVENFEKLAKAGFYDGLKFHRVIKGFMIQTGDPLSKDEDPSNDGTGGPGYAFEDEFSPELQNISYAVAMANSGPNTNGSQFFINEVANHHLDNVHTVFGQVYRGQEIVRKIADSPTDTTNHPLTEVFINKLTISGYDSSIEQISEDNSSSTSSSWVSSFFKIMLWILLGLAAVLVGLLIFAKIKLGKKKAPPSLPKKNRKKKKKKYGRMKKHKR